MDRETPPKKRRKHGARLFTAYALQALIILLTAALIALVICGFLYIGEHLFSSPDTPEDPDTPPASGEPRLPDPDAPTPPEEGDGLPGDATLPAGGSGADGGDSDSPAGTGPVVALDAGHGGVQPGCDIGGVLEKDITLAVTRFAAEILEDQGVTVVLTRDSDEDVSLEGRCIIANDAGAELFVSVHCNSYDDTSVSGFEGYYHRSEQGQRLAELILAAAGELSVNTRNVKDANYQVLRDTVMPSALMEIGFMTNPDELSLLQTEEYQRTIAQAIADGVMAMLDDSDAQ